ncbi:MAG: hypothetical protein SV765_00195 [Pseudomonadota bacterium]|nr:hypothetical protein [Pseudomonadota bacterium]
MTNDFEEKRQHLETVQKALENLKAKYDKVASEQIQNPTTENQQALFEIKNTIQKAEQSVKQLTIELAFDEKKEDFHLENVGQIEEVDQTASLRPNIPSAEGGGTGRALGKGKELSRENNQDVAQSRTINYIDKNTPVVEVNDSNEIEKDNSIEPEI